MNDDVQTGGPVDEAARKDYVKPDIVHELKLETRAGTPTGGIVDPLTDPLNLNPK